MDRRKDIQEFLTSRRARLTPGQVGLPGLSDRRRVAGLRREEVALLAGVSVDYYARLERGHLAGASDSVLQSVADALRLDEAEYQHLLDLARTSADPSRRRPVRSKQPAMRPAIASILAGLGGLPAYVRTHAMDVLAANQLCRALYDGVLDDPRLPLNLARFLFLDPQARDVYLDWDAVADDLAGALRIQAGRDPRNRTLSDLVGELSTRSDDFVARWSKQNVRLHHTATKRLHNRVVGDIELTGNALQLPSDDLVLIAYTADPGSPAEDQLKLLAAWSAARDPAEDSRTQ